MRVLITGATGFIGRALAQRLIAGKVETFGLALEQDLKRLESSAERIHGLTLFPADLREAGATTEAVAHIRPDRIIHLAAAGVVDPAIDSRLAIEHNVHGTLNLLRAAFGNDRLAPGPGGLIVIRTPGETRPSNAYTASKAAAWSFCQMHANRDRWPIVGARIFQAYGPGQPAHTFVQAALHAALSAGDFAMTSGLQTRDWIYVDDVAGGLMAVLDADLQPGASVDLGTGVRTSLFEVAQMAYRLVGRGGAPSPGALPDRSGERIDLAADAERTERLLNWTPQIPLSEGLRLVMESLVSQ